MTRRTALATAAAATATPASAKTAAPKPASGLVLRPSEERGKANHGWLRTSYSFSFSNYFDPRWMGFESLRVINDDYIAGGGGFPTHPHDNMEIFSYILEGALQHRDTMGNGSIVKAGGIQYMSAGSGVAHSEFNPSQSDPVRLLQIWLLPNEKNAKPRYDTLDIAPEDKDGKLKLFLSPDGRDGSMSIRSDANIFAATLKGSQSITHDMADGTRGWIQVAGGSLSVNGHELRHGDGLAIREAGRLTLDKGEDAEIVYFEFS